MANQDIPRGFKKVGGAALCPGFYDRDADGSTPIFPGDLVAFDNDGLINAASAGDTALLGAADDFATGSAAKTNIAVYDDPDEKFTAQDEAGATPTQTYVGLNADHLATAGSLLTKISAHEIDIDTASTATFGLRLLDFINRPDNTVGVNVEWVVRINEHAFATATGE